MNGYRIQDSGFTKLTVNGGARTHLSAGPLLFLMFCTLLALCCAPYPVYAAASPADDAVTRIQKAYENIRDITGSFIQKSHIRDLKRTDTYKGQFFIKASKMKWEYKGDKAQAVYINGDDIVIYQKKEKQAFKARFDRATYGQAPIALLGGLGDIRREFDVSMKDERLLLKPKNPMGSVSQVELSLSDGEFPIESLTVTDNLSNRIEIKLRNVRINTGLRDAVFEFVVPEGVTVLQN